MPPVDSRTVELNRMKTKLVEMEGAIKEEKKAIARLIDQNEKKYQQIMEVEGDIAAENERFRWAKEEIYFQMDSTSSEAKIRIDSMKLEENHLLEELSEFAVLQYNNEQLHDKLKKLSLEHKRMSDQQLQERERRKQKDFDVRMAMDEIFRKTLRNVDETYEKLAIDKMRKEAANASAENDEICKEFDLRERQIETLIRQQQHSYDQLMKLRIEKDVLEMTIETQEQNIAKIKRQNAVNLVEVRNLMNKVNRWQDEVQALQSLTKSKALLEDDCHQILHNIAALRTEIVVNRKQTMTLCHKLLNTAKSMSQRASIYHNNQLTERLEGMGSPESNAPQALTVNCDLEPVVRSKAPNQTPSSTKSIRSNGETLQRQLDSEAVWRAPVASAPRTRSSQRTSSHQGRRKEHTFIFSPH